MREFRRFLLLVCGMALFLIACGMGSFEWGWNHRVDWIWVALATLGLVAAGVEFFVVGRRREAAIEAEEAGVKEMAAELGQAPPGG